MRCYFAHSGMITVKKKTTDDNKCLGGYKEIRIFIYYYWNYKVVQSL